MAGYVLHLSEQENITLSAAVTRRLIDGGGVKIDQQPVEPKSYNVDPALLHAGCVLQVGKRKFARLV